jgi:hypothetical protein
MGTSVEQKRLKEILFITGFGTLFFFVIGAVMFVWWHQIARHPLFSPTPAETFAKISEISDVEHLRKVTLLALDKSDTADKSFEELASKFIDLIVIISVSAVGFFAYCGYRARQVYRAICKVGDA